LSQAPVNYSNISAVNVVTGVYTGSE